MGWGFCTNKKKKTHTQIGFRPRCRIVGLGNMTGLVVQRVGMFFPSVTLVSLSAEPETVACVCNLADLKP